MSMQIEILKTQSKMDNQELKKKVLEKNEECKRLNNKLQEAKVFVKIYILLYANLSTSLHVFPNH